MAPSSQPTTDLNLRVLIVAGPQSVRAFRTANGGTWEEIQQMNLCDNGDGRDGKMEELTSFVEAAVKSEGTPCWALAAPREFNRNLQGRLSSMVRARMLRSDVADLSVLSAADLGKRYFNLR